MLYSFENQVTNEYRTKDITKTSTCEQLIGSIAALQLDYNFIM